MPAIHTTIVFERFTEETPKNWESVDPGEHDLKHKYREDAKLPPQQHFEGFTVWVPNKDHPVRVHLKPGNKFSYTILRGNKNMILLDGEDVGEYTDMPSQ